MKGVGQELPEALNVSLAACGTTGAWRRTAPGRARSRSRAMCSVLSRGKPHMERRRGMRAIAPRGGCEPCLTMPTQGRRTGGAGAGLPFRTCACHAVPRNISDPPMHWSARVFFGHACQAFDRSALFTYHLPHKCRSATRWNAPCRHSNGLPFSGE